jgi:hypothetical protein
MAGLNRVAFIISLAALALALCGCPPLHHKIFIANTTPDTTYLTLVHRTGNINQGKEIEVRYKNEVVAINNNTLGQLNEKLLASADSDKINLAIPPKSTAYFSDVLESLDMFSDKTLIIRNAGKADTMISQYPYKKLKNAKRKRDKEYNYFYRTIINYKVD